MKKRWAEPINAGAMADIAFLLLIFFLMVTTLEEEKGIKQKLPPKELTSVVDVHDRDVLEVRINANNELLVEEEPVTEMIRLRDITIEFLTNKNNRADMPEIIFVTENTAHSKLAQLKSEKSSLEQDDPASKRISFLGEKIDLWEKRLAAVAKAGEFYVASDNALVSLTVDNKTSYHTYIDVMDELHKAHLELRNYWSQKIYKENYTDWNELNTADIEKINVIQTIVPLKIAEQIPNTILPY